MKLFTALLASASANFGADMSSMLPLLLGDGLGGNSDLLLMMMMGQNGGDMNSLLPLLLSSDGGDGKLDKLLPFMMMGNSMDFANNPLLMMSLLGEGSSELSDLLPLMMMQGGNGMGDFASNPLLMMSLLDKGDSKMSDDLLMMMMMGGMGGMGAQVDEYGQPIQPAMNPMLMYMLMKEDTPAEEESTGSDEAPADSGTSDGASGIPQ